MFSATKSSIFVALAFATLSATGCGTSLTTPTSLAAQLQASTTANGSAQPGMGGPGGRGDHGDHGNPNDPQALLASLTLTADQQTQLAAIVAKYKPTAPTAKPLNDANTALQTALLATTVDDATLRAAIAAQRADMATHQPPSPKDELVAIRALLTSDQIATVVAKLQAGPTGVRPSGGPGAAVEASLNLTTAQQADLAAFKAAMQPASPTTQADPRAAMLTFWQTGDTSGLVAPAAPTFPVEAFVTLAEALDLTQRQALFAHGAMMMADGGHGGPGGQGGPGGHGGFGGPDGDRGPAPSASPSAS
jgi:Spy/CpxP family protein refolding chaperone